jgi:hypothetical protein
MIRLPTVRQGFQKMIKQKLLDFFRNLFLTAPKGGSPHHLLRRAPEEGMI